MTHTPGPWDWQWNTDFNGNADGRVYTVDRDFATGSPHCVAVSPRYQTKERWEADARLIAAAPDMKSAGNELATAASDIHPTAPSSKSIKRLHAAIDAWDAIIAKAEGAPVSPANSEGGK